MMDVQFSYKPYSDYMSHAIAYNYDIIGHINFITFMCSYQSYVMSCLYVFMHILNHIYIYIYIYYSI